MRLISLLLICPFVVACAPTTVLQTERDAVRAVWDVSVTAALEGDYDGWAAVFSDDVEIVIPDASLRLVGEPAVEAVYRRALEGNPLFTEIDTQRFDVKISPRGDVAWGTAEVEVTAGGVKSTSWYALVYRKEKGQWKMALGYNAKAK